MHVDGAEGWGLGFYELKVPTMVAYKTWARGSLGGALCFKTFQAMILIMTFGNDSQGAEWIPFCWLVFTINEILHVAFKELLIF